MTVLLLILVGRRIDWELVGRRLAGGQWQLFALALGILAAMQILAIVRWQLLLAAARVPTAPARTVRAFMIGLFSNTFLPTSVGGDATRVLLVAHRGSALQGVLASVLVDRAVGVLGMLAVAWAAIGIDRDGIPSRPVAVLLWVSLAVLGGLGVVSLAATRGGSRLARLIPRDVRVHIRELRDGLRQCVSDANTLAATIGLSVAIQALFVVAAYLLAGAVGISLAFGLAAVALPLVVLLTLIPISIAGFGVREGGFVVLLAPAGIGATDATLVGLLIGAAITMVSLPGALWLLLPRGREAEADLGALRE